MAGAGAGGGFHVAFGINETQLTSLLEQANYTAAEQHIRDNDDSSYLDEGCYLRTPLYIVLSGIDQNRELATPRHLYLAKLLVERGANVNHRVPETLFGSEYMGPGKTPLELVVDFYNVITNQSKIAPPDTTHCSSSIWDPICCKVIGVDKQFVNHYSDMKEQLMELLNIMIAHNGDVNVRDSVNMTPLHRTMVFSSDIEMVRFLCEYGRANVKALDSRGNTPLASLCDSFSMGLRPYWDGASDPYTEYCDIEDREEFLLYMLQHNDIQLDTTNKTGHSCLFHCMARGDTSSSRQLLLHGCDPTLKGTVMFRDSISFLQDTHICSGIREISPLFVSLCSLRVVTQHIDRYMPHSLRSYQFIAHLVDAGFFTRSAITAELFDIIDRNFQDLINLKLYGSELVNLMFGGTTCSLRQLATRTVFHRVLLKDSVPNPHLFTKDTFPKNYNFTDITCASEYMTYLVDHVTSDLLSRLVSRLQLPMDLLTCFQIELLRQRICSLFQQLQWFDYCDVEIDEIFGHGHDMSNSDENDSDLEYW